MRPVDDGAEVRGHVLVLVQNTTDDDNDVWDDLRCARDPDDARWLDDGGALNSSATMTKTWVNTQRMQEPGPVLPPA